MKKLIASTVIMALSIFTSNTFGASVIPMTMDDLVAASDKITVARCIEVSTRWQGDKVFSDSVLEVTRSIKGDESETVLVTTLGGKANHPRLKFLVDMEVPGGVSFEAGEEVLVFTKRNDQSVNQVVGLTQGKFVVEVDSKTGEKVIPIGRKVLTNEKSEDLGVSSILGPIEEFDLSSKQINTRKITLEEMIALIEAEMKNK